MTSPNPLDGAKMLNDEQRQAVGNALHGRTLTQANIFALADLLSASKPAAPMGWKLVRVNEHFDALIEAMERAQSKGYLPDAIAERWDQFACDENVSAAPAVPTVDLLPNELWTRHGSGSFEWWSFKGYEARKDEADQWVLRKAGKELYRHTDLQVAMVHAEREILAASPAAPAQSDFDAWMANPYTKTLMQSIETDYVPKHAAPVQSGEAVYQARMVGNIAWSDVSGDKLEACAANPNYEVRRIYASPQSQPAQSAVQDERAAFEAWMLTRELDASPNLERDGEFYEEFDVQRAWRGWQARAASPQATATPRTHTTQPGESVMGIALRQCGNEKEWRHILACNPKFSDMLPHEYFPVGTVLTLPPLATATQPAQTGEKS